MIKRNATSFRPGRKKTGGRKAGAPNMSTRILKEASLLAAEAIGNKKGGKGLVSFFEWAATRHTASFMTVLNRSIPQQLEIKQESHTEIVYRTVAEIHEELVRRGVPIEMIYRKQLADEADEDSANKSSNC
jgi:hypothetical protein